ncbi:hypothetical protein [Mucilaginibacter sp. AK015]|uniref:hypothetical protein n=1 Tax=Mucilaginibacter sp. AK015 TaxID=2723072 RepID=UPI00160FC76D|nr:hypothetical protein [Mucilaginibacter sp. AK015]MBB5395077.1 hypothetical protein [Mucilaginibacter sp. AK015]
MNHLYKFFAGLCLIICSSRCTTEKDPFSQQGVDLYGKDLPVTLNAYNDLKTGTDSRQAQGAPSMYVDFSAGMYTAFGTPVIRQLMSECFNTVLDRQFAVYKLVQGQVSPIAVHNPTELGQIVNDPKQYLDRRAPIQAAVEKIVGEKSDALLITDFEEWQDNREVTSTAYLKIAFSKWLQEGNSISFFIADYREGTIDKHIYFTIFTYGHPAANSLVTRLRPKMAVLPAKFDLATDAYRLTTEYPGAKTGGIFYDTGGKTDQERNVLDLQPGYINGMVENKPFEYYPLGVNWETIAQTRKDYADQGQFRDLFRRLFIDLSNTDSYRYQQLEVKTFDATADYERYARSLEVKKHKPKLTKGSDGQDQISDKETDAIALACYNPDGTVKAAYRYEPQEAQPLTDVFVLNQTLFGNTFRTDKAKTEIGIAFAPAFALSKIPDPKALIRVMVSLSSVTVNSTNPVLEKFKWMNAAGTANTALYGSVISTIEELKPTNKPIYTYYIKTTE